jgi:hypothetical protein
MHAAENGGCSRRVRRVAPSVHGGHTSRIGNIWQHTCASDSRYKSTTVYEAQHLAGEYVTLAQTTKPVHLRKLGHEKMISESSIPVLTIRGRYSEQ